MLGTLWAAWGPARGRGRWLRSDSEQVKALPCSMAGPTVCLWELRTCW